MDVRLITPLGALFAITAAVPVLIYVGRQRRLRRIRQALRLGEPTRRSQLSLVLAIVAIPALLGLAATQPVLETTRTVNERTDVQAFAVLDVSRSMLASAGPGAPTRVERAQALAVRLRAETPEVPFGIASLTDRTLPHLLPTTDARVFAATIDRAVGIEKPPPSSSYVTFATNLNALRAIPEKSYFPPAVKKRVVVVLTDGESRPPESELARAFKRRPQIKTVFVHVWDADERIYETGVVEGGYRPSPRSRAVLVRAAALAGGQVIQEGDAAAVARAVREAVGEGQTVAREEDSGRIALMPYVTLAALAPLVLVLLRRNVWWQWRRERRQQPAGAPVAAEVSPARGVAQPG
ncbi:MAG: VWA domain-containing protein [Thermoleophilia bacterium]|nr:VWA domain-containing protein [Thermoleophilia bacterium]MDH4340190.1 VWA domain-containing protein [Thermoleophilia bacterium]